MKQNYLAPETSVFAITFHEGVMTTVSNTGSSTTNLTVVNSTSESDWEY